MANPVLYLQMTCPNAVSILLYYFFSEPIPTTRTPTEQNQSDYPLPFQLPEHNMKFK